MTATSRSRHVHDSHAIASTIDRWRRPHRPRRTQQNAIETYHPNWAGKASTFTEWQALRIFHNDDPGAWAGATAAFWMLIIYDMFIYINILAFTCYLYMWYVMSPVVQFSFYFPFMTKTPHWICLIQGFFPSIRCSEITPCLAHHFSAPSMLNCYMSDDLNLGWLIHYVSGHRMPKPCTAMGNLKSDTLSLIHHMNLWITIWICLISITAAPPKYYHILLLSSKYSKRSRKVLQRITTSHYQELQRMDLLQPATCFSQIRCPSER